ncbi:PREDICTED: cytochrome P450 302a1, mitochondrial-like isoform X1 [Rhagoletis zephyria]|uniref:cytochrome P450 302a1, mitochondrial-like isoform X1 n=1 Tax=Rhagoletis zephyria TaxID=28612 RepID=UPI0008114929|nr:PREDICTED: cytochrome P450 302a1, mitochondrial-like isoform X1 [Rhagoletis zephyria]
MAVFISKSLRKRCFSANADPPAANAFAKPFNSIPGPRGPFGLGVLYQYLPVIGRYSWLELHKAGRDKYERYGSIVRETMIPGEDIVWLYDPNDIATLLNEREFPQRRSHLALEKYRKDRPHIYRSAGLLPTNGAEWWHLRSELQKEISAPKSVRSFLADLDLVTQEFLEHLPLHQSFDIQPKLARLNLELTCLMTFDERLNAFSPEEQLPTSRSTRLMRAAETTNSSILPTDQGLPLWRYFETPIYRRLRKAQEYMESVAIDLVSQKLAYFKDSKEVSDGANPDGGTMQRSSLIEEYLKNPNLDLCDVVGMAADLLLAGIDTSSYTTAFAVYHIAKNPEVQRKLSEEACRVLPSRKTLLTPDALRTEVPYARAVLKEVFRLNPISVGVGRILNKDLVLSGYHVPKGTVVVTQNMIACRLEKYFSDALKFDPERWLHRKQAVHPYLVLPFGHGMRACIARRMAEQNIIVLLLRMLRNFEITWTGDDEKMGVRTLLINKPSRPVSIQLKPRVDGCGD